MFDVIKLIVMKNLTPLFSQALHVLSMSSHKFRSTVNLIGERRGETAVF
jgi:hypothetical protein